MANYAKIGQNGEALYTIGLPPDSAELSDPLLIKIDGDIPDHSAFINKHYYKSGEWKERPVAPPFHKWDNETEYWVPVLNDARRHVFNALKFEINERGRRPCNGFDADSLARSRISGLIARIQRGDGLTLGWMGWRDANNNMHWATDDAATVLAHLSGLSSAIENREQALLIAAWTHKYHLAQLTTVEEILAYDVNSGWPE